MLHPIVDWATSDVWEYTREHDLPRNPLYAEGFKRVGCVMCPMARRFLLDIKRWPKMAVAYRKAVARRWVTSKSAQERWRSPDEMWTWWVSGEAADPRIDTCSLFLFEDDPEMVEDTGGQGGPA